MSVGSGTEPRVIHDPQQVVVFLGPSLPMDAARRLLDADFRPPAAQGDVYRAALGGAAVIVLIDGRFGSVPAVWHKEVLAALAQGVHVLGAASMGALRAAELADFGMEGHGVIFGRYHRGELTADDAVAVAHAGPESGHRRLSEALVDIQATLDAAHAAGIVDVETAAALAATAERLHYPRRTWGELLEQCPQTALADWLPTGRVEQKRRDAEEVLRTVADRLVAGIAPRPVDLAVEDSQVWARARTAAADTTSSDHSDVPFELIADELRLTPGRPAASRYAAAYREALLRHALLELAGALQLGRPDLTAKTAEERAEAEQEVLRRVEAQVYDGVLARLPGVLAAADDLTPAVRCARRIRDVLAELGGVVPRATEIGTSDEALLAAHAGIASDGNHRRRSARAAGFASEDDLRRALVLRHLAGLKPENAS